MRPSGSYSVVYVERTSGYVLPSASVVPGWVLSSVQDFTGPRRPRCSRSDIGAVLSSGDLTCATASGTARIETAKITSFAHFTLIIAIRLTTTCQTHVNHIL